MIELRHVTRLYGLVIGVNDLTASLPLGAYGLLGPNGSGKSTLLNLLTGRLRPTLGSIRVLGETPWNNSRLKSRIGVCPEHNIAYTNVTALQWVSYLLRLHGFDRREATQRTRNALEQVGLGTAMQRPMGGYSRGMRQRAKLAQAIAHDPELLILDEPFNGLDPVGRHETTDFLRAWIGAGKGLLLASHILHEVEQITSSFLLICGGRLLASGSAEEVNTLLADVPNQIFVRCNKPELLAQRLLHCDGIDSLQFRHDQQGLMISTRSPASVYQGLPKWIDEAAIEVEEIRCTDDSLQALFNSLLRIHRGKS